MLHIPDNGVPYATLFGIDPGSENLGVSIMRVDIATRMIVQTDAFTIVGSKLGGSEWSGEINGARFCRIAGLHSSLTQLFRQHQPFCISTESPFNNPKRPQAYGVLMEVMASIRQAVTEYDPWTELYLIDPSSVKNAVGAPGNAKKEVVQAAMAKLTNLCLTTPIEYLDEHSIDAIAVNYTRYIRLFGRI